MHTFYIFPFIIVKPPVIDLFLMAILMTNRFSFLFWQLGYIIYRRVLRYYSGEEDGLGEVLIHLFYQCNTLKCLYCLSLKRLISINRYEEGIIKRCGEKVGDSSQKTYHT